MDPKTPLALALSALVAAVLFLPSAAADATAALDPVAPAADCGGPLSPCSVTIDATVVDGVLAYTVSPSAAIDCGGATVGQSPSDAAVTEIQVGCDPGSLIGFETAAPCTEVGVEVEASGRAGGSGSSSCGDLSASCGVGSSGPSIACEDIDSGSSSGSWHCSLYVYAYSGGHASAKCWVVYG